jgi:CubicO group peptidase (beta-lactamase class C family)
MRQHSRSRARQATLLAAAIAVSAASARAVDEARPPAPAAAIDDYVERQTQASRVPGLALVVVDGRRIVHARGFGRAAPDGRAATPDTPFALGSLSKSFTALAVMQLVEAGRLELDAPAVRYVPWFRTTDEERSRRITLRHLLHHTSGIPQRADCSFLEPDAVARVRCLARTRLARDPGGAFEYANPNYTLLGLAVEAASGQRFEDYVESRVFAPLHMTHSFASRDETAGLAVGHQLWFGWPLAARRPPAAGAAEGGLVSCANDVGRYLLALSNGGALEGARVLSAGGVELLLRGGVATRPGQAYAMGWYRRPLGGVPSVSHGGSTPGFGAFAAWLPDAGFGLALLCNSYGVALGADTPARIATGVARLLAGREAPRVSRTVARGYWLLDGAVVLMVMLEGRSWWRLLRAPSGATRPSTRRLALAGLADLAVAGGIALAVPAWFRVNLRTILAVPSDLGLLLAVGLTLGVAMGLLKLALAFARRR